MKCTRSGSPVAAPTAFSTTRPISSSAGTSHCLPTRSWIFELAYLPFSHGGPSFWPWLNFRIGLQYTHWNKFGGATTNIDGMGRNASGNNRFFAYIWTMF